jgi:hypothetical protein
MSNVGHHGRRCMGLVPHSLRSVPNAMHSHFSASFHSGEFVKHTARFSRHQTSATFVLTRCYASRPSIKPIQAVLSTLRPEPLSAMRHSAWSQSLGAAGYGSPSLSLRPRREVVVAKSSLVSLSSRVPCRSAMPNPSIEGDVQGLAPLAAPHVKRWASLKTRG